MKAAITANVLNQIGELISHFDARQCEIEAHRHLQIKAQDISQVMAIIVEFDREVVVSIPKSSIKRAVNPEVFDHIKMFNDGIVDVHLNPQKNELTFRLGSLTYRKSLYGRDGAGRSLSDGDEEIVIEAIVPISQLYSGLYLGQSIESPVIELLLCPNNGSATVTVDGDDDRVVNNFDIELTTASPNQTRQLYSINDLLGFVQSLPLDQTIQLRISESGRIYLEYEFPTGHGRAILSREPSVKSQFEERLS